MDNAYITFIMKSNGKDLIKAFPFESLSLSDLQQRSFIFRIELNINNRIPLYDTQE